MIDKVVETELMKFGIENIISDAFKDADEKDIKVEEVK